MGLKLNTKIGTYTVLSNTQNVFCLHKQIYKVIHDERRGILYLTTVASKKLMSPMNLK